VIAGLYCVIDGTVLLLTGQLVTLPDLRKLWPGHPTPEPVLVAEGE
jgi:hypothetical protein